MNLKKIFLVCLIIFIALVGYRYWANGQKISNYRNPCRDNLYHIQWCKLEWMEEHHKTTNDIPNLSELSDCLEHFGSKNGLPICQKGGIYTVGRAGEWPKCSIGGIGHSMGNSKLPEFRPPIGK